MLVILNLQLKEKCAICNLIFVCFFSWAKGENDSRKTEIANLDNFAHSENDARKNEIANLDNFAKSENDGRKQVIIMKTLPSPQQFTLVF
jgi:hypothetical protein